MWPFARRIPPKLTFPWFVTGSELTVVTPMAVYPLVGLAIEFAVGTKMLVMADNGKYTEVRVAASETIAITLRLGTAELWNYVK